MFSSYTMFLEINSQCIPLEIGQIYLLGKQLLGNEKKHKGFIELESEDEIEQKHCVIDVNPSKGVFAYDLVSAKGTLLNNRPLKCLQKILLKSGDILKLGKQEIKYIREQDMSHDSSGFIEVNKNTSDIIASSPVCTSLHESRIKRINTNNFLVPSTPAKKSKTPNMGLVTPGTEALNISRKSLNTSPNCLSSNNRRSDGFTIPETQYCTPRNFLNDSIISIAESIAGENAGKIKFNFGNIDLDDDDLCIPETQEVLSVSDISSSQRPRLLSNAKENSMLIEESSPENNDVDGSQFRICTQDYNEGFGEEHESMLSQIIPVIKHSDVILNTSTISVKENSKNHSKLEDEIDKELAVKLSNSKVDQDLTELRADCTTPDIFDFENKQQTEAAIDENKPTATPNVVDEDEEDLLPTQVFPSCSAKSLGNRSNFEQDKPCVAIETEEVLTLSDKENRCPVTLQPVTDLPATQLFAVNEVSSARSSTSNSSRNSLNVGLKTVVPNSAENKNNSKSLLNLDPDEEDDVLTQELLQPQISSAISTHKNVTDKCFNSTVLEDKFIAKNPHTFFADIEKTPLMKTIFKMPDKDFSVFKKTSSGNSTTRTEADLDLLMCTPQLIKEHMQVDKADELKKNILAAKNKHLFGEDTDDEDDDQSDLVKLINKPKDTLDFDKLLPHLQNIPPSSKIKGELDAKEANKMYKFNISFGREQDEKQSKTSISKSSTLSRDERHVARDKERELAERIQERNKSKRDSSSASNKREKKSKQPESHKSVTTNKKEKERKDEQKQEKTRQVRKKTQEGKEIKKDLDKETKLEEKPKETPPRRMTRAKARLVEQPSTSKAAAEKILETIQLAEDTDKEGDDLDSIVTQPFVVRLKRHSGSKQSSTVNGSITTKKSVAERKRKAEPNPSDVPAKKERKLLKPVTDSFTTSSSTSISISMTMVDQEYFKDLFHNSRGIWSIAKSPADSEILVMDKAFRTFKFLLAMARGIPIVTSEYLKKLNQTQSLKKVKINDYLFMDAEFDKKHKCSLIKSQQQARKCKLFKGYEFVMTAQILPCPKEIKDIIEAAGGFVHAKSPPPPKDNQKIYLITSKEDNKDWHKYRRLNKNIRIVSTEAIMTAVIRQSCESMSSYALA